MSDIENSNSNQQWEDNTHEPIFNFFPRGTLFIILAVLFVFFLPMMFKQNWQFWINASALRERNVIDIINLQFDAKDIWPLFGYQLVHSGAFHMIMNMAMLIQVGPICEISFAPNANPLNYADLSKESPHLTTRSAFIFVAFFLICGVAAAFGGVGIAVFLNESASFSMIGASGSISGVFAGYLWSVVAIAPKGTPLLGSIAQSAIVFLVVNVGLAAAARYGGIIPIAWEAHLAGFLAGLILYPLFYRIARSKAILKG